MIKVVSLDSTSQRELETLVSLIEMSEGRALAICICNQPILREAALENLQERLNNSGIGLAILRVKEGEKSLVGTIERLIQGDQFQRLSSRFEKVAISVEEFENAIPSEERKSERAPEAVRLLNQQRDSFLTFQYPVILWLPEWLASRLPREAPDFWRIRTGVFVCKPFEEMRVRYTEQLATMPTFAESAEDIRRRIRILQRLIEGLGDEDESEVRSKARLLTDLGNQFLAVSKWQKAKEAFKKLDEIAARFGDKNMLADAMASIGIVHVLGGDYEKAENFLKRALEIGQRAQDQARLAAILGNLGVLEQRRSNYVEARRLLEESLDIERRIGASASIAGTLYSLGVLAQIRGDYEEAKKLYEESLVISRRIENRAGVAQALHGSGMLAGIRGDYEEATRHYEESLTIARQIGDKAATAMILHNWGVLSQDHGEYEKARKLYEESLVIERQIGNKAGIAQISHELGRLAQHAGEYKDAKRLYDEALEVKQQLGDMAGVALTLAQLGVWYAEMGDFEGAAKHSAMAREIFRRLELHHHEDRATVQLEWIREQLGEDEFKQALKEAEREVEEIFGQQ